jgi:glucan phosphoethanolaminetransferase (alkaline phosphatase superfamily)
MEEQIDKWKNMWQKQKSNSLDIKELIQRLNQIGKKEKLERIKLSIVLLFLVVACLIRSSGLLTNTFFLISYILILIAIFIRLIPLYKSRYGTITKESDLNNHDFIKLLTKKVAFKTKHLLLFLSILILSLNITLLGLYEKGTVLNLEINNENRIFFHLATIVLFIVAYLFNKRKLDNSKKETLKLISDLESNDL